jgi:DeoR/GlpR family transcriptional regulator of sugar metabolism
MNVYLLNGFVNRVSHSTIGVPCEDILTQCHIAKAFCGAAGFTLNEGLTDNYIGFVEQKKVIVKRSQAVIGLVDSSKFGIVSLGTFARKEEVSLIITDGGISRDTRSEIEHSGIKLSVV